MKIKTALFTAAISLALPALSFADDMAAPAATPPAGTGTSTQSGAGMARGETVAPADSGATSSGMGSSAGGTSTQTGSGTDRGETVAPSPTATP